MKYTDKTLWKFIDGDVVPSEVAAFREACAKDPALVKRFKALLQLHELFKTHIGTPPKRNKNTQREEGHVAEEPSPLRMHSFSQS